MSAQLRPTSWELVRCTNRQCAHEAVRRSKRVVLACTYCNCPCTVHELQEGPERLILRPIERPVVGFVERRATERAS